MYRHASLIKLILCSYGSGAAREAFPPLRWGLSERRKHSSTPKDQRSLKYEHTAKTHFYASGNQSEPERFSSEARCFISPQGLNAFHKKAPGMRAGRFHLRTLILVTLFLLIVFLWIEGKKT